MSEQEQQPDTPSGGDEDGEWHTLVSAFRMYKAAYGDLKVPSRFVVPAMAPWPETAWQLKLGQRVAAIRSTGRYVQNSESRRKALDDMGFLWRLRAPSPGGRTAGDGSKGGAIKLDEDGVTFDQVYDALKTYRQSVQPGTEPLNVPPSYEVPDCEPWPSSTRGLPLGKLIPSVRSKSYLKSRPGAREKLAELGFVFDGKAAANDLRYRRVFDALVRYKEIYGDLLVPQPFSIPETGAEDDEGEIWPDDVRGLRLGARVNAIRSQGTFVKSDPDRREQLDELGFVWEPPANADGKRRGRKRKVDEEDGEGGYEDGAAGASLMEGLTTPYGAPSGLADAGLSTPPAFSAGGDPFANMERGGGSPQWAFEGQDDIAALEEEEKDKTIYEPKKAFNETLEDMAKVAMSIGIMESWTDNKRVVKGKRPKYIPWFNDDFGADFTFEDVVEALTLYKDVYGSFDSIEEDELIIPEPVEESLRLSPFELAALNDDADQPSDLDDIDGINAPWNEDEAGIDAEGADFSVVASSDWPEHLAGMKLGQIVGRIRDGGLEVKHLPERKKQLDAIGFDWGDPKRFIDIPFEKAMCAMYTYFLVRGDMFVLSDFTMPDEEPWPIAFQGYPLGKVVERLRELQNFLEAYHPMKMSLLRMVDFVFFPEMAIPLDPDAGEMNMEHLYVETFGHPLYHISTVPLGLPEKMLADGPSGPPEKLSSWYNYDYVREFHERPGALTDVADWMRGIGFHQLAEEHEAKYGQSHYRQLVLLKEQLDDTQISQDEWDEELDRIAQEVMIEFESWKGGSDGEGSQFVGDDGEYDYSIDEDEYYYNTLEIASSSGPGSMSQGAPPLSSYNSQGMPRPSVSVVEEPVAEFALGGSDSGDDNNFKIEEEEV